MPICEPHWTAYSQALLIPIVTVLGLLIAWRQWRTARNKLKLDLFDRRFAVYDTARTFLGSIATSGKVHEDELTKFMVGTREARWLLNPEIEDYMNKEIYVKALHHQTTDEELRFANPGEDRTKLARAKAEQRQILLAQFEVLNEKFKKFLSLEH